MMTQDQGLGEREGESFHLPDEPWQYAEVQSPTDMWRVFDLLEAELTAFGYPEKDLFAVKLVVGEAIVNAVRHGHQGDRSKRLRVRYVVDAEEVLVQVRDEGPGFDHRQYGDLRGEWPADRPPARGLFLMQVYSSWMRFNPQGNIVTLCRKRSA